MGAVDIREMLGDANSAMRSMLGGFRETLWSALPVVINKDSADGHTATANVAVKGAVQDGNGNVTFQDYPILDLLPITHPGGGGTVHTFPVSKGDEGIVFLSKIPIDSWHEQGAPPAAASPPSSPQSNPTTAPNPTDTRQHSLSDGMYIGAHRSNPRKLAQVSTTAAHLRSDTKQHVHELDPIKGFHTKSVDPSTAAASPSFDPFTQAKVYFEHVLQGASGIAHNAVQNGITHALTIVHSIGPVMSANNLAHFFQAHPSQGTKITSSVAHQVSAPNVTLTPQGALSTSLSMGAPTGSFGSGSIGGFGFGGGGAGSGSSITLTEEIAAPVMQLTTPYTVAALNIAYPPASNAGLRAYVTDATGVIGPPNGPPVFLKTLVGSGTYVCPAFCDGVEWVSA